MWTPAPKMCFKHMLFLTQCIARMDSLRDHQHGMGQWTRDAKGPSTSGRLWPTSHHGKDISSALLSPIAFHNSCGSRGPFLYNTSLACGCSTGCKQWSHIRMHRIFINLYLFIFVNLFICLCMCLCIIVFMCSFIYVFIYICIIMYSFMHLCVHRW